MIAFKKPVHWLVPVLFTTAFLGLAAGAVFELSAYYAVPLSQGQLQKSFLAAVGLVAGGLGIALLILWLPGVFEPLRRVRSVLGPAVWALALVAAAAPIYLFLFSKWSFVYSGPYVRSMVYVLTTGIMAWLAAGKSPRHFEWKGILSSAVVFAAAFGLADLLKYTVSTPLSLYWSEGNRMWDNSILFGRHLYDFPNDQRIPVLSNWVRQSVWGLPFLLPEVSIAFVRMWNGLVFSVPYMIFGWVLFHRNQDNKGVWLALGLWTFVFLNQGPIYTPLVLAAVLVVLSRKARLWSGFFLVAAAGFYASEGRYTWMFAPGMWAAVLALVEAPPMEIRTSFDRWKRAIIFGLGGLTGGYLLPEVLSKANALLNGTEAGPSVVSIAGATNLIQRQPLMWDRLWPNETYSLGIIYGLLLTAGPLAALLIYAVLRGRWRLDLWQKIALTGMLLAFLVVGIIVSVKIGGGSNLHNLDMFLIGLVFAGALAWEAGLREMVLNPTWKTWPAAAFTLLLLLFPAWNSLMVVEPLATPDSQRTNFTLRMVQMYVDKARDKGELYFLDQRQLLTFGYIKDVPLVPDYEKKLVMDHAMAEDTEYFNEFYRDLSSHRFSLIVSEPLRVEFQGGVYHFGNENDAWVRWVAHPMLCYYEPVFTMRNLGVQLLLPKPKSQPRGGGQCPGY